MKHKFLILCSGFLLALPFPGKASAQSLMESGIAGTVGMGALYGATKSLNNPGDDDAAIARLQQQGFTNIAPVPSSSSQYSAFVPNLGPVIINVDPATGQVLSVMPR